MSAIKSLGLFLPCGNRAPTPRHNKLTGAPRDESVIVEDAKVCDGGGGSGRFDRGSWLGTLPYLPCLECRRGTGAAHLRRRSQAPERSQTSFLQLNQIVYMRVCWMISPRLWWMGISGACCMPSFIASASIYYASPQRRGFGGDLMLLRIPIPFLYHSSLNMTAESRRETLDLGGETWDEGCFGWVVVPRQISKPLMVCKFVHLSVWRVRQHWPWPPP